MEPAIETIEYLARLSHRVGLLESLANGPRERRDLRDSTGPSPPSLGRILTEFDSLLIENLSLLFLLKLYIVMRG